MEVARPLQGCRQLRQEGLSLYFGRYVVISSYEAASDTWRVLSAADVFQLTLLPWKHDFVGVMSAQQARGMAVMDLFELMRTSVPYRGICIQRWATPKDGQRVECMDVEKQNEFTDREAKDPFDHDYYAYVYR